MLRGLLYLMLFPMFSILKAQTNSFHALELGSGTVVRSFDERWDPYAVGGIKLIPVDSGRGEGYFIAAGWGRYPQSSSNSVQAYLGIRLRYQLIGYVRKETGEQFSPSSFIHETYSYDVTRTVGSLGLSFPVMVAIRSAPWGELRMGLELSGTRTVSDHESGQLTTITDHYTLPWSVAYTTSTLTEHQGLPTIPSKFQLMVAGTIGYRQRIGHFLLGPDVTYPLLELLNHTESAWMVAFWAGWCLQ